MKKVGLVSLGCPKNLVDSEVMLGTLVQTGYEITPDLSTAEIIIINTCSFIEAAKKESLETIFEIAELKKSGKLKKLIVAGCLPQRYISELTHGIPEVDSFLAVDDLEKIGEICGQEGKFVSAHPLKPPQYIYNEASSRILTGTPFSAYVKIADGCDNPCSFCTIPRIRGRYRSRPLSSIVTEVRDLAEKGVKEINLVAQDTTAYGSDLNMKDHLADLLIALSAIDGIKWIRMLYGYPSRITDRLLETIFSSSKVCTYLDIPFQHSSSRILRSMKRGGNKRTHMALIERIRRSIPGIALRTSVIVGYPGETRKDFNDLITFCRDAEFEHLGVFQYSREDGTEAFDLGDSVAEPVKEERERILLEMQQKILKEKLKAMVGGEFEVLCEGVCEESDDLLSGRLESQAPGIDGRVLINEGTAQVGDFVKIKITESHIYDLIGSIIGYV